jgi:hypothetical protein
MLVTDIVEYTMINTEQSAFSLDPPSSDDSSRIHLILDMTVACMRARMTRAWDRHDRGGQLHMVCGWQVSDWGGSGG